MEITPIILAGGSGTRLWPLSRSDYPKQFLKLNSGEHTLLQNTVLRVCREGIHRPIIVCHEDHRFIVSEQLKEIGVTPAAIILEQQPKNTAPAIALAAHYVRDHALPENLWIMPADHLISDDNGLYQALMASREALSEGSLVVFGTEARSPETAYGYIHVPHLTHGIGPVVAFTEKPDLATAQQYLDRKNYYWNCGIFAFRADVYLNELKQYAPDIVRTTEAAIHSLVRDGSFVRPQCLKLITCPDISIDYALMEKTQRAVMTLLQSAWNDMGSWNALSEEYDVDSQGNVSVGEVVLQNVSHSYLHSENRLLAASHIHNQIVVVTDDAVLIGHKDHCQDIKALIQDLRKHNRPEIKSTSHVHRPWGWFHILSQDSHYKIKKISVNPHQRLSLQSHAHRSEHWVVISGIAHILNGEKKFLLQANESTFIPPNTAHSLANETDQILEIIEVQVGNYLGEDDIIRYEDCYGRITTGVS